MCGAPGSVCGAPGSVWSPLLFCAGGADPQYALPSLCAKSWLLGDPSPAHAGSPHPGIDFRGIPQVIPADG